MIEKKIILVLIRYICIIFCTSYIFEKLIHTNFHPKKNLCFNFSCWIGISILSLSLPKELQFFVLPIMGCIFILYFKKQYTYAIETIFTVVILSMSICYSFFHISALFIIVLLCIPCYLLFHYVFHSIATQLFIAILQTLFCILFFRIKRFKYGMSFLKKSYLSNLGVYIGSMILICAMLVSSAPKNATKEDRIFFTLLLPIVMILFFNIYIWCKHHLRKQYMQQVKEREYTRLEEQCAQSLQEIKQLKEENERLSKIVHRDNKLIPSMQLAVQQYLNLSQQGNEKELETTGLKLMRQLNQEIQDRSGTLFSINPLDKQLPTTSNPALDQCLRYMWHKCENDNISVTITISENIAPALEAIAIKDLQTLLADLIENARIALKNCTEKHLLVQIKIENDTPALAVWDTASLFPKEVLYHFGRKRYTTHKNNGGSGIGMIAIHEILERYQASIIIDEKLTEETLYTKKVEISFDNRHTYMLHTKRSMKEYAYLSKRGDLQILAE